MGLIFPFRGVVDLLSSPNICKIFTEQHRGGRGEEFYCCPVHEPKQHTRPEEAYPMSYTNQWEVKKKWGKKEIYIKIYLYWIYTLICKKYLCIIHEYCCWNMGSVISLLFLSGYCWKINGFLEQINHHLAAVTGRTEGKIHICCAQYLNPFLSYECEWDKVLVGVSNQH